MAYKYKEKEEAKELYIESYSVTEISKQLKINRGTLNNWINKGKWKILAQEYLKMSHNQDKTSSIPQANKVVILNNIITQAEYLLSEL